ncbi:MAG TPA: efflux RND transporter periplasmic adaptor subunit [Longimicrobiales bacterium]|nr:efflux RND transporter periplasmic adaptor subunit [Longimicrobiales bacterium]
MRRSMRNLLGLALVVVVAACGNDTSGSETAGTDTTGAAPGAAPGRVVNVEVLELAAESFEDVIGITGTVEAERDVTIASEESGVVREVFADKGRSVRAGQPILKIDDRVLRAQYDQAVSEAALARETYDRQRRLWEDEKIGSEMNFLRAKYGAETADANARMLAARLERTVVRAPIDGILDARFAEVGAMVGPGTPVARIIDIDPLKVLGGVPERYAGDIRTGATATVVLDNFGDRQFAGRIRFVGAAVNEMNRTFPVEVTIPNSAGALKPGMVAKVQLARGDSRQALVVPREAVLRTETGYIVYVVREEAGRPVAQATAVVLGPGLANRIVLESGVQAGDRVIVVGQQQVANGDNVEVVVRQAGT